MPSNFVASSGGYVFFAVFAIIASDCSVDIPVLAVLAATSVLALTLSSV